MSSGSFGSGVFFSFAVKSSLCWAQPSGALHLPEHSMQSDGISCIKGKDWQGFKEDTIAAVKKLLSHQGKKVGMDKALESNSSGGQNGNPSKDRRFFTNRVIQILGSDNFASFKWPLKGDRQPVPKELLPKTAHNTKPPNCRWGVLASS